MGIPYTSRIWVGTKDPSIYSMSGSDSDDGRPGHPNRPTRPQRRGRSYSRRPHPDQAPKRSKVHNVIPYMPVREGDGYYSMVP